MIVFRFTAGASTEVQIVINGSDILPFLQCSNQNLWIHLTQFVYGFQNVIVWANHSESVHSVMDVQSKARLAKFFSRLSRDIVDKKWITSCHKMSYDQTYITLWRDQIAHDDTHVNHANLLNKVRF